MTKINQVEIMQSILPLKSTAPTPSSRDTVEVMAAVLQGESAYAGRLSAQAVDIAGEAQASFA